MTSYTKTGIQPAAILDYHRILTLLTSLLANPFCELTESERKQNYLELVEKLDHAEAFDGDLVKAVAGKVMVCKKSLVFYFVGRKWIHREPVKK